MGLGHPEKSSPCDRVKALDFEPGWEA